MPQRPKPEVREAILTSAAETFASVGFERATLGDIVERAGTSIGNLYKYFANKDELFAAFDVTGRLIEDHRVADPLFDEQKLAIAFNDCGYGEVGS